MNVLLDSTRRIVVGHRGNSRHAPENTMESFQQAIALGVDAIELDVRLSSDGIAVVHHDPGVARTTGGTGFISSMTAAQLGALDAGTRFTKDGTSFPFQGKGIRIPRLEEVLSSFSSTAILIELKTPEVAAAVRKAIDQHRASDRCVVDSFNHTALRIFEGSGIPVGAAKSDVALLLRRMMFRLPVPPVRFSAMCIPLSYYGIRLPVRRFAQMAPSHGFVVHVWTINNPAVAMSLWREGVSGIISDDPSVMIAARAQLERNGM